MDRSIRLGLIMGSILILLLIVVVYLFKPPPPAPLNTAKPKEKPTLTETTLEKKVIISAPVQANPVPLSNQAELIQQRDRLYQGFAGISDSLSHGEQPDLRQVSQMLDQQKQLVKTGIVTADEAISYCQFLKQILPVMDHEIQQHILQLQQLKQSAI